MDAVESLVSILLSHDGYWTTPSFKVKLTVDDRLKIGRPSSPRWELDLIAYKGSTNELLAVECKSLLDSTGVTFLQRTFRAGRSVQTFNDKVLRSVVLKRFVKQLQESGSCAESPEMTLCIAIGKIAGRSDREGVGSPFCEKRLESV